MSTRRVLLVLFSVACACVTLNAFDKKEALAHMRRLPETNPYKAPLARYLALSEQDRARLDEWAGGSTSDSSAALAPPGEADLAIVKEIASALRNAAKARPLSGDDWPITPSQNPLLANIPPVGPFRQLGRLSVKYADTLPPEQAIETYAAVAQFGRNLGTGDIIIQNLTGVALEGIALAGPARRLGEFTPEQLRLLSDRWAGLRPQTAPEEAVHGERDMFFVPFRDKMLRSALASLLAKLEPAKEEPASFTRDLRLAGLMDLGEAEQCIVLEDVRRQIHFTLKPGQPAEGIELVSLDFDKRRAVIRREEREAVIDLESRRISERRFSHAVLLKHREEVAALSGSDDLRKQEQWLASLLDHPRGLDGFLEDLTAAYDKEFARQLDLAARPTAPTEEAALSGNALLDLTLPTMGRVARTFHSNVTQSSMLQAAIGQRLRELGQSESKSTADPWAENKATPFDLEPAKDGGFLLRSRYELKPGQPLTYKFAAPDAGFIRAQPKQ